MTPPVSWPQSPPWWQRNPLRTLPVALALSIWAGLLVVVLDPTTSLLLEMEITSIIGLTAWGGGVAIARLGRKHINPLVSVMVASVLAIALGLSLAGYIGAHRSLAWWLQEPGRQWRPIASAVLLTVAAVTFVMRDRAASDYRMSLEAQLRQVAEARQGEALARLALLQAQIEPHFLFNTLANVQSMIERDPRTAARMLDHLNRYLRAALGRTRGPSSTCGEEMELIGALLAIAQIRLGQRLRHTLRLPEELRAASLPPLLLQPLVENALKHGIEPAVDGGEIEVACSTRAGRLVLTVRDTGMGFQEGAPPGVGLSNIRARLSSLYGTDGELTLHRNEPRGTVAQISLPLT
jgi:sensor histidine kinase YesM